MMDLDDKAKLRAAIDRIREAAKIRPDDALTRDFLAGKKIEDTYYDKLSGKKSPTTALVRSLLIAESFIRQPDLKCYYDIFRAARFVTFTRVLDSALDKL